MIPCRHQVPSLCCQKVKGSGPGAKEEATTYKFPGPPVPDTVNHGVKEIKVYDMLILFLHHYPVFIFML